MLLGQFIIIITFSVSLCVRVQCFRVRLLHNVYCVFTMFGVKYYTNIECEVMIHLCILILYLSSQTW